MKSYKRKMFKEMDYSDRSNAKHIRKSLNSSERLRAKRDIVNEQVPKTTNWSYSYTYEEMQHIRYQVFELIELECDHSARTDLSMGVSIVLQRLNIVKEDWINCHIFGAHCNILHRCNCSKKASELSNNDCVEIAHKNGLIP